MLTLYHHGSSVCAAKVRIYLHEKGIDWEGEYVDILKGDQFDPAYLELNPKAVVPALVHDGTVITESTVICEYIENVFPDQPIRPADPVACAHVMYWTKSVDEDLHPACAALTFMASHRHTINRLGPEGLQKFLDSIPPFSVSPDWHEKKKGYVRQAFDAPDGSQKVRLYDDYILKMEKALANGEWLVGDYLSFADIAMMPYLTRLDMMSMSGMWENGRRPRVTDWFERVKERPSYKPSLLDWVPDTLRHDLSQNGARSWPDVAKILEI
jgi:glutathione S-transferase